MEFDFSTRCACCGRKINAEEQLSLPEVERYERTHSLEMLGKQTEPVPMPTDAELKEKYGYEYKDLFCAACLQRIIESAK